MVKNRLAASSDGVIAVVSAITIMVLELKVSHGDSIESPLPLAPMLLSSLYVGTY